MFGEVVTGYAMREMIVLMVTRTMTNHRVLAEIKLELLGVHVNNRINSR